MTAQSPKDPVTAPDVVDAFCAAAGHPYLAEWGTLVVEALEGICRERIPHPNLGYIEVLQDLARVKGCGLDPLAGWMEGAPAKPVMEALAPYRAQLRLLDEMNQKVTAEALIEIAWVFLDACTETVTWADLEARGAVREQPEPPDWDVMW